MSFIIGILVGRKKCPFPSFPQDVSSTTKGFSWYSCCCLIEKHILAETDIPWSSLLGSEDGIEPRDLCNRYLGDSLTNQT